ncbi:MAG TPA: hypothetical protein VLY23_13725 [Candidatus Acidoferrum sp.]|nr:hypothetical protein [Candidatus Acidoferrum sp.]
MKHFSTEEWADFARGVADKKQKAAMQSHLEAGCKQCEGVVDMWKKVHDIARRDAQYEPPQAILRTVKAMYAIHGKPSMAAKAPFATLLFDSFQAPLQAGVRSSAADVRQLLYGSGNHRIDLRLEPQVDSEKISLVGQLLNSANPAATLDAVPVALLRGRRVVAESATNRFGEFHFECELDTNLQLRATLPDGSELSIPLVDPIGSSADDGPETTDSKGLRKLLRGTKKGPRKKV